MTFGVKKVCITSYFRGREIEAIKFDGPDCMVPIYLERELSEVIFEGSNVDKENNSVTFGVDQGDVSGPVAVGLSPSILDLPEVGAEVVRLAFRCAFHVDRVARTLEVFDPESPWKHWIYVILNESEQNVRDQLEAAKFSNVSLTNPICLEF